MNLSIAANKTKRNGIEVLNADIQYISSVRKNSIPKQSLPNEVGNKHQSQLNLVQSLSIKYRITATLVIKLLTNDKYDKEA